MRDLTQGNPLKLIIKFVVPIMIGNLFQQFYNLTDTIIVGHFVGADALAAVGSTGFLYFLIIGFVSGMCSGFSIPISRCFGAKDMDGIRLYLINLIYLSAFLVSVITAAVLLSVKNILLIMNTPSDIFESAYSYIFVIFAGLFATVIYNLLSNISRALGDSRTPLYFLIVAAVLNIGLDILFVVGLGLGTFGAGLATVIAQAAAAAACFIYMRRKFPELYIEKKYIRPDLKVMWNLIGIGIPMALQFSITAVGGLVLQGAINALGTLSVAAITVAGKVQMILTQPLEAMGQTMATYSSQNIGALKLDRVKKGVNIAVVIVLIISAAGLFAVMLGGANMGRIFVSKEDFATISDKVNQYLSFAAYFYFPLGLLLVLRNSIQGLGYTLPAMAAGVFEMIARGTAGIVFVQKWQFFGACMGNPMAWIAANILLVPVYFGVIYVLKRKIPAQIN